MKNIGKIQFGEIMVDNLSVIGIVHFIEPIFVIVSIIITLYAWTKGILPVLVRLGIGLSKREIAIFAKGDNFNSLKKLLIDSKLFNEKNIIPIRTKAEIETAEKATLFLIFWHDWQEDDIDEILRRKKINTAFIVYSPPELGHINLEKLNEERNVALSNFRGRLLNDIVVSMITTSYEISWLNILKK